MRIAREFISNTLIGGMLVILPLYLAVLLLLRGMRAVAGLVRPLAVLVPDWLPAEDVLALLLVVLACFVVGVFVRTSFGHSIRERLEVSFFSRLPGYALFRSLTQRLAGQTDENVWMPALIEIEDALVPGFIIEEHADGRLTVFVPSVPTPLAGAVYVLDRDRVHAIDVPFTQAVQTISKWGSGSKNLVAALRPAHPDTEAPGARP